MTVSTTRRNASNSFHTTLMTSLTSGTQTSSIILNAIIRNGVTVAPATDTQNNGGVVRFYRGSSEEHISFSSCTVDSSNNITLVGVTRDLVWNDGTSWTTNASGIAWPAGTFVDLVIDARAMNSIAYLDIIAAHTAPVTLTGGTTYFQLPTLTTTQRNSLAAAEGMLIKNSTTGLIEGYVGGGWNNMTGGSVADATSSTKGKSQLAALSDTTAQTAGAVVIPASLAMTTSSSAGWAAGGVPVLNSSKVVDVTLLGTGSPSSSNYLRGDGSWVATSSTNYRYGTGADGALNVTSGTTTLDFASSSVLVKNYSSINISNGATVNATNVPAAGGLLILLSQGNVTIAGTLDLSSKGSSGGATVTKTTTGNTTQTGNGSAATTPFNAAGQTRTGGGGQGVQTSANTADGSGGCGGSNAAAAASSSAVANNAPADTAGVALTAAIAGMGASSIGMLVGPGAGGDSGGVVLITSGYASGTFTVTSGAGGLGGGGLYIACGGNLSFTGTINLSGANGASTTLATGSATSYALAVGGNGGGSAGTGKIDVAGTITNSGTVTATGGTKSTGQTAAAGSGYSAHKSDGTDGAAGTVLITQSY